MTMFMELEVTGQEMVTSYLKVPSQDHREMLHTYVRIVVVWLLSCLWLMPSSFFSLFFSILLCSGPHKFLGSTTLVVLAEENNQ